MNYITLEELTWCELLAFERERGGLQVGGSENETRALNDLCRLAESHPETDV
jgi:hypothetical protein